MKLTKFLVCATRELPGGLVSQVTKAIEEETPADAMNVFCSILGISPQVINHPEQMGTGYWDIVVFVVRRARFRAAIATFNRDPIRSDFRTGAADWWGKYHQ